jgi:predicted GTPase
MSKKPPPSRAVSRARWLIVAVGMLLPTLSLVPIGSIWLWQHGYLLVWAGIATVTMLLFYALSRWLLPTSPASQLPREPVSEGDPGWAPAEAKAWERVQGIVAEVVPDTLTSREAVLALGQRVIETVATTLHPDRSDALWQFTAPEALALTERVSGRLRAVIGDSVPLGDRLTIAQLMQLYRWRGSIRMAETAWDVWRALRVVNPATALAAEVRERLSKAMLNWGRDHLARRIVRVYIEEVGRAAIDLYAGRLMAGAGGVTAASKADAQAAGSEAAEPLRVLVAGQTSAGKSSLVNALAAEVKAAADALPTTERFTAYVLERDGFPAALLIDAPGLGQTPDDAQVLVEQAGSSDLVLWVVDATRAAREKDRAGLAGIRAWFAARPNRKPPPMICVLTHIDRLRPFQEWAPPYDLNFAASGKSASIREAVETVASELGLAVESVVPVALGPTGKGYNVDVVWARIHEQLDEALSVRLVRTLRDAKARWDWQKAWSQAKNGGRVLVRNVVGPVQS